MSKVSPFAPATLPLLPGLQQVLVATDHCGIKYKNRDDVCLIVFPPKTSVAGVFTNSLTASAPVLRCRQNLRHGEVRAIIINAGNSNAFTGKLGDEAVTRCLNEVAKNVGCSADQVFMASTGVIGEPLPDHLIRHKIPSMIQRLQEKNWLAAARSIMTTDTYPKMVTRQAKIGAATVTINAIAKGSGMIAPDMATMLAFIVTDAKIPSPILQKILTQATSQTFNCITVDGDTSTSDTLIACSTGSVVHADITKSPQLFNNFRIQFLDVMKELAWLVVKDGEGISKFVTITVTGAASKAAARCIGMTIANSPLVKTAIAGEDANWGRIVAAVGRSGQKADRDKLSITIGGVRIAENGLRVADYNEHPVNKHMKGREINIEVDVGVGNGIATVWTCDLTHGYIDVNGSYRS